MKGYYCNWWAAEAWILQSHTAGQMSMQRRHGELNDSRSSDPSILCWQKNIFGFGEASFACWLMIMHATGCSGASASAGTLVTTNHLLLLLCWQCAKQSSIRTQMERKYQNLPMHLMFGSFDGSRASWYVAKKIHISSQQTCSVLKSSTVALPVAFRSSEEKLLPSVSAETSWSWHRRHVRPLQN